MGASAQYAPAVKLADLADSRVAESSGLATSRRYPDLLWTHNDSGNAPYLFATNRSGAAIACFQVSCPTAPVMNVDWEDMAEGPAPGGKPALYIADIGDNNRVRNNLAVYRVIEPDAYTGSLDPAAGPKLVAQRFPFVYPGGAHYDAEALLVHPTTAQTFVVTKDASGTSYVFKFPKPLTQQLPDQVVTLSKVATVKFTSGISYGRMVTGGDISPDGKKVVLRTYTDAYEWPIVGTQSVGYALANNPRKSFPLPFNQGESVAYRPDGLALLTTSEGTPCPLYELPPKSP
jgi:hypothetical protein